LTELYHLNTLASDDKFSLLLIIKYFYATVKYLINNQF